jgi:hypothetical protein
MPPIIPERIGWQIVGLRRAGVTYSRFPHTQLPNEISCDLNIWQVLCPKSSDVTLRDVLLSLRHHLVGHERRQHEMIVFCIAFVEVTECKQHQFSYSCGKTELI